MTTCMMTYPPARCTLPVGHDGPHATRDGYGWHDSDDMDGGVAAALIEKEAEPTDVWRRRAETAEQALTEMTAHRDRCRDIATKWQVEANMRKIRAEDTLSLVQQQRDQATARAEKAAAQLHDALDEQAKLIRERDEAPAVDYHAMWWKAEREREKAERERDEARETIIRLREEMEDHDCIRDAAVIREPRPLTPGDITDEMVERAREAWLEFARTDGIPTPEVTREMLTAALTDPPTRPEGAEHWEDFLIDSLDYQALTDQQIANLADKLAEHGVRVVTEEQP